MSDYDTGNSPNLYDRATGKLVGAMDLQGKEQLLPVYDSAGLALVSPTGVAVGLGKQQVNIRAATFGDSTANNGWANTDLTSVTAPFPGSGATSLSFFVDKFGTNLYYQQMRLIANGGVSGETTTQMLARSAAGASATRKAIEDIAALNPDVIFYRGGSINDLLAVTAGTKSATIAATLANHRKIVGLLRCAAPIVIDAGLYGFTNGTNVATDQSVTRQCILELNAQFKADASPSNGVYYSDSLGTSHDSTGTYISGMTTDGTHLSLAGALLMAQKEAAIVASIFGIPTKGPVYKGVNLVTNPLLSQTGAVGYGTQATGYTIGASNVTRQNAKVEVIDGRYWQTCEFVPTTSAPNASIYIPANPQNWGVTSTTTDYIGMEYDFFVEMLDGSPISLPSLTQFRSDVTKTANGRVVLDAFAVTYASTFPSYRFQGHVVFPLWLVGELSANLTNTADYFFSITLSDTRTFKLGISSPRIVKNPSV